MTPPAELVRELRAYDKSLRIRWGHRTQLFIVERAMEPQHKQLLSERPNPFKNKRGLDLWDGWREGYVHIVSIHPTLAPNTALVLDAIAASDIWRAGGLEAMNRKLDAIQEAEARAADRAIGAFTETAAKESYDHLAWALGHRVAVTPPAAPELEPRDGYLVHDRRVRA